MESDLVQAMLAFPALAAALGVNITWGVRKQGALLPAIVLHIISAPERYTLTGRVTLTDNVVQADVLASGFLDAQDIGRAVRDFCDAVNAAAAADPGQVLLLRGCFVIAKRGDLDLADGPQPASGSTVEHCVQLDLRVAHNTAA